MPCLLVLIVLLFPRVILVLMWLFSNVLDRAYHGLVIPLLGFIFLPITTIVYAWMVTHGLPIQGFNLVLLIIAVLLDAGSHGGGMRYSRRRNY
jgi:phosphoglycerol transferase MdoB-like AlkP superfamily enzyme